MKEISKIKKIYKGFFPDETVSEERMSRRREQCFGCEFNSVNVPAGKLSAVDYARNKIMPPFCTLCKCQIHEKTQSPFEDCAMYMVGKELKWNRTRIENIDESMNITNLSPIELGLRTEGEKYIIDYGVITSTTDTSIELLVDVTGDKPFSITSVQGTCGCTLTKFSSTEDNKGIVNIKLNLSMINSGRFIKDVYINYRLDSTPYRQNLRITGFKK